MGGRGSSRAASYRKSHGLKILCRFFLRAYVLGYTHAAPLALEIAFGGLRFALSPPYRNNVGLGGAVARCNVPLLLNRGFVVVGFRGAQPTLHWLEFHPCGDECG